MASDGDRMRARGVGLPVVPARTPATLGNSIAASGGFVGTAGGGRVAAPPAAPALPPCTNRGGK
jgi:hypothetical protein